MTVNAWAAAWATTARSSGERRTMNRHSWALAPEGAQVAAWRQRARVASSTGSSVKRRIVRAVDIAVHTSSVGPDMHTPPSIQPVSVVDPVAERPAQRRPLQEHDGLRVGDLTAIDHRQGLLERQFEDLDVFT